MSREGRVRRLVKSWVALFLFVGLALPVWTRADGPSRQSLTPNKLDIVAEPADAAVVRDIRPMLTAGMTKVERFFGKPFPKPVTVAVMPTRVSFDARLKQELGGETPQRWMVAMGVARGVVVLSPRLWKTEADEHDGGDPQHVRDILVHELVHVYHSQVSPSKDFEGMDDLAWLVEGVAVYVSGQLERSHRDAAARAVAEGKAPSRLAGAWTGGYRYGVSGSIVRYVDRRFGRQRVVAMLRAVKPQEALGVLGVSEEQLLEDWRRSVNAAPLGRGSARLMEWGWD